MKGGRERGKRERRREERKTRREGWREGEWDLWGERSVGRREKRKGNWRHEWREILWGGR